MHVQPGTELSEIGELIDAKIFSWRTKIARLTYEPSGEDFLSPCLGEADVMQAGPDRRNSRNG